MRVAPRHELPPERERTLKKAVRLEWISLAYLATAIVFLYLTMGSSQAMKTAWIEDCLALVPPIAFLLAHRLRERPANARYPFGYHRAVTVGYLVAAVAILGVGSWLLLEAVLKFIHAERPSMGTVELFGVRVWLGWLAIAALAYTVVVPVVLGRMKLPLSRRLHDKLLFADATMNKADWLTAVAGIFGVLGIALGLWWADPLAATVIAIDIIRDGWTHTAAAVTDLMDRHPDTVDGSQPDAAPEHLQAELERLEWVDRVQVRLREAGHVFFGTAYVTFTDDRDVLDKTRRLKQHAERLDWRLQELVVMPVRDMEHTNEPADTTTPPHQPHP